MHSTTNAAEDVRLLTLDPGHFHASLVQKSMYPQVSPVVHVYAPAGPDLQQHLQRIESFNSRAETPTRWEEKVYTGPDFLEQMIREKNGNVVVIAGNNARKTEYIARSVEAGLNVLADKPMAITPPDFDLLRTAFEQAAAKKVLLYDIMTERHEITTILQRELARMPELFGKLEKGTPEQPAIVLESVHYFFKDVAGKPLIRPAWFFDVREEGEAIPDVGTHLVDQVFWQCFPEQSLDWRKDIKVLNARRWPTKLSLEQFSRVTGLTQYADFLKPDVRPDGQLNVFANGEMTFSARGVCAKVTALWKFEAPPGAKDTHQSLLRGTRANLKIKQTAQEHYLPVLYIENKSAPSGEFEKFVRAAIAKLCSSYPGIEVKPSGSAWEVVVPEKYNVGHEAHFAQVTADFLGFLKDGKMPPWEVPNILAKYYATTEAYRLSHAVP